MSQLTTQYQVPLISNIDLHIKVKETESEEMALYRASLTLTSICTHRS